MNTRWMVEIVAPAALGASTALGLLAAGVAPVMCTVSAAVVSLWLLIVVSVPERGDA